MSNTATELIAHLEAGGLIARGAPKLVEFLRFEIYGENRVKHLGAYGWGSALGRIESRLIDVLQEPHTWVCLPVNTPREAYESVAAELLGETGEYVNYDWQLSVQDERETNTPKPQPDLLTTIRKEAREAAFRDATAAVHEILVGNRGMFTVFDYVKDAIEAAANSEEGAGKND